MICVSNSRGNGADAISSRTRLALRATSSMSRARMPANASRIAASIPPLRMNARYASAVMANPSGTFTPSDVSSRSISPREAFLPPTVATSSMVTSRKGRIQFIRDSLRGRYAQCVPARLEHARGYNPGRDLVRRSQNVRDAQVIRIVLATVPASAERFRSWHAACVRCSNSEP